METVAILPAFNLEDKIENIVKITKKYADLVIVISDGSVDNTFSVAEAAGAFCPPNSLQKGKGFAIRKGIEFSKQFNPKYIVMMDADGQHLPKEIPKLIKPLQNGKVDMVLGSRVKGILRTSIINRFGNCILSLISFVITGKWFSDTVCGFKAFKADKLYNLKLNCNGYEIENELLLKAFFNGYSILEIPITVPIAIPGIKKTDGFTMAFYNMKNWYKIKTNNIKKMLDTSFSLMKKNFSILENNKFSSEINKINENFKEKSKKKKQGTYIYFY